jgi:ferredoxin-NADP reductase
MANPAKIKTLVTGIRRFGIGTYELALRPLGRVPHFKAGQFLHFTLGEYDPAGGFWPESRVFSIASRNDGEGIKIVYSVKGSYTRLMEEKLRPGLEVWIKLPFGNFIIDSQSHDGCDSVLIAGGTGISPFIPYVEEILELSVPRRLRLYYGISTPNQLLFRDILVRCRETGAIDLRLWIETINTEAESLPTTSCVVGRLDPAIIYRECRDLNAPDFFLSGPPAMIKHFMGTLVANTHDPDKIHIDAWE